LALFSEPLPTGYRQRFGALVELIPTVCQRVILTMKAMTVDGQVEARSLRRDALALRRERRLQMPHLRDDLPAVCAVDERELVDEDAVDGAQS